MPPTRRCSIKVEGLVVDKGIHLGHLKWTLETSSRPSSEREDITLRLRPSYFPFTEPSVEVDVGYSNEGGRRVVGGHGRCAGPCVDGTGRQRHGEPPRAGIRRDRPNEFQGFAFGLGIDRIAMLKLRDERLARLFRWRSALAPALRVLALRPADIVAGVGRAHEILADWLKDHLETNATVAEICDALNAIGLRSKASKTRQSGLRGFRVAHVLTAARHPPMPTSCRCHRRRPERAKPLQVVCGAPNARAGMKGVLGGACPRRDRSRQRHGAEEKRHSRGREQRHDVLGARVELGEDHDGIIRIAR